jgi:TPR repeat protein
MSAYDPKRTLNELATTPFKRAISTDTIFEGVVVAVTRGTYHLPSQSGHRSSRSGRLNWYDSTARPFLAYLLLVAGQTIAPSAAQTQAPAASIAQECFGLAAAKVDWFDHNVAEKHRKLRLETCRQAYAENGDDPRIKVALAGALRAVGDRPQSIALLRAAIAQNDTEAMLDLFNDFNSFDRNANSPDLIPRAEAEQALRRAAELGNPDAIWRLVAILTRGGPIRHDLAGARHWARQALANPPNEVRPVNVQVTVGQLLSESDDADERKRGIDLLEPLAKAGRGDAQAYLAVAIRSTDPVRARQLLESARGTYPGAALAPLSDMLIKGEGGPKNERRALALLKGSASDAQYAKWALGQLMLEGRLVPRDVAAAIKLLGPWSQWDYDTRLQIVRLLADNPEVQMAYPDRFIYTAIEDAELGEPGAMDALIALKLSRHVQFADKASGCMLAERAAKAGDDAAARHLNECRAN